MKAKRNSVDELAKAIEESIKIARKRGAKPAEVAAHVAVVQQLIKAGGKPGSQFLAQAEAVGNRGLVRSLLIDGTGTNVYFLLWGV